MQARSFRTQDERIPKKPSEKETNGETRVKKGNGKIVKQDISHDKKMS